MTLSTKTPKPKILAFRNCWLNRGPKGADLMGGTGYYRIRKPLEFLHDKYDIYEIGEIPEYIVYDGEKVDFDHIIPFLISKSDLVFMKNISQPGGLGWFAGAADYYDVPLLLDMDDNYLAVDDLNPRREYFVESAVSQITHKELFKSATAITVSTQPLVDVYKQFNPNVHVLENYNDINDWKHERYQRKSGRIVIGWAGSLTHESDFREIEKPLLDMWDKYGERILFSFCGAWPQNLFKRFPKKSFEVHSGTRSIWDYPQALALWGFDIGIAPIKKSAFNDGKAHGKWMEYSMYKIPTVATNFGPYSRTMEHGRTGLLADSEGDWVKHLSSLVESKEMRDTLGQNAYNEVKEKWQWQNNAYRWDEVFKQYLFNGFKR